MIKCGKCDEKAVDGKNLLSWAFVYQIFLRGRASKPSQPGEGNLRGALGAACWVFISGGKFIDRRWPLILAIVLFMATD